MRSSLESKRPLDANVEKDGAKEIKYSKDSYEYLFDEDELFMLQQMQLREELRAEGYLEDDKFSYEDSNFNKSEMEDMIAESMQCWDSKDLGKYTIGTPTQDKKAVESQEKHMEPVSEMEFQEIADDADPVDLKLQEEYARMVEELEGIF